MSTAASLMRDANRQPIWTDGLIVSNTRTYTGTAGNGGIGSATLFTVTGDAIVVVFASCTTSVAGTASTIEVGINGNTAALIAQTNGTAIQAGEIWLDATPATIESLPTAKLVVGGTDIVETIASGSAATGVLKYYCLWRPLSSDADIT